MLELTKPGLCPTPQSTNARGSEAITLKGNDAMVSTTPAQTDFPGFCTSRKWSQVFVSPVKASLAVPRPNKPRRPRPSINPAVSRHQLNGKSPLPFPSAPPQL